MLWLALIVGWVFGCVCFVAGAVWASSAHRRRQIERSEVGRYLRNN